MSTLTEHLAAPNTPIERRFYSRVAPQTRTQIAFGSNFQNTVLNVSENGLLVSATSALQLNSVQRVSLTLNGISKSISVYVRTVWSENSQGLAGIQLLDLAEDDRELIRRWSALQSPQVENPAQTFPSQRVAPSSQPSQSLVMLPGITATPANTPVTIAAPTPENCGSCATETSEEKLAFAGAHPASQSPPRPAASPLIFWIAALSVICLAAVSALAYNLYTDLLAQPARSQAARASSLHHHPPPVAAHTSANPTSALNASPQEDASDLLLAETATKEKSEPDAPTYHHSNVNAPPELPSRTEPPSAIRTRLMHSSPSVSKHLQASPFSARDSAVADSTLAVAQSTAVAAVPAAAPPNIQTAAVNPAPGNTSASNSTPRTLSVDAVPNPSPSSSQSPSANSNAISSLTLSSTPNSNSHPASNSLAASKSPRLASPIASAPTSNSKSTTPSLAFPSSSPSRSAETSTTIPRNSNSSTANLDVPQTHPGPRIVELTPYSYNTFVNLPGERVIQSPALTIHIQRSVWVRGGRWFWRGRKKVVLGQLSSRLDPQFPRTARYGTITVQATIDKEGRITSVRPLYGSPAFLLNVSKAIREWRYEPTYVDNKPVETQAKIEVDFHSLSAQASRP
jgi:hypothetical protein